MALSEQLGLVGVAVVAAGVFATFSITLAQSSHFLAGPPPSPEIAAYNRKQQHSQRNDSETSPYAPTPTAESDKNCPFRHSAIYRKVYVYPSPGEVENGWKGEMLSHQGSDPTFPRWRFLDIDDASRVNETGHYNTKSQSVQYSTELLVREVFVNPRSCLRTYNAEEATLFFVPYLPSVEHHMGSNNPFRADFSKSPFGEAILDIIDGNNYEKWEHQFGLTSKYWKRRAGVDHILVFSEPMHGLYHPRNKRGNFHFIHTQKQLAKPIVISVELSRTFVEMYPKCAAKNILMPYPNTDGTWFNGRIASQTQVLLHQAVNFTPATLPSELQASNPKQARPIAQFYSAGSHGTCTKLRKAMKQDYQKCSPSHHVLESPALKAGHFSLGMRLATFCPAPGGDSPSAKRHYDSIIAGCIPIILSHDFVWPFTNDFDPNIGVDPSRFALRLEAKEFENPLLDPNKNCQPLQPDQPGLQAYLESIRPEEIQRLRTGMEMARDLYSWYKFDPDLPDNPLRERVLPEGGAAHQLVKMLAERASGAMWPACEAELKQPRGKDPTQFKC